jgi:hypothetical protein
VRREETVRRIRRAARARSLIFTEHAYDKMDLLGETAESVSVAIQDATSFVRQNDGSWRVFGDGLTCVVVMIESVVVVTLFA